MRAIDLDYQSFVSWTTEQPRRGVRIEITGEKSSVMVGEWIGHDYVCQVVAAVSEIDLVGKLARQREEDWKVRRLEYERLEAEFGRGCTECPHDVTKVFHYPNG